MSLISQRVALACSGANDKVICKMASGWAVMGDVQFLPGYCLLLPDPVVSSLNDLDTQARTTYLLDMARLGDAVLQATDALRMNYEILGNLSRSCTATSSPLRLGSGALPQDAGLVL